MKQVVNTNNAIVVWKKLFIEENLLFLKNQKLKKFIKSDLFKELHPQIQKVNQDQFFLQERSMEILRSKLEVIAKENNLAPERFNYETKGEQIIGRFNGSKNTEVDEIKLEAITLINTIEANSKDPRRAAIAYTDIEKGVLMAIKSLF